MSFKNIQKAEGPRPYSAQRALLEGRAEGFWISKFTQRGMELLIGCSMFYLKPIFIYVRFEHLHKKFDWGLCNTTSRTGLKNIMVSH